MREMFKAVDARAPRAPRGRRLQSDDLNGDRSLPTASGAGPRALDYVRRMTGGGDRHGGDGIRRLPDGSEIDEVDDRRRRSHRQGHHLRRRHPRRPARRRRPSAGARLRPPRGLSQPLAAFRRGRRPLGQPHRRRPLHDRRRDLPALAERERPHPPPRRLQTASASGPGGSSTTTPTASRSPLTSPDGEEGYPGTRRGDLPLHDRGAGHASAWRPRRRPTRRPSSISPSIATSISTIRPTSSTIDVRIFADAYTPTDADKVPTGEIAPVAGTDYDFRQARARSAG